MDPSGLHMKTGSCNVAHDAAFSTDFQNDIHAILAALMVKTIETASRYTTGCGRDVVTSTDMQYAIKYEAHVFFFRESLQDDIKQCREILCNSSESEESETDDTLEDNDENESAIFCRNMSNPFCVRVNNIVDSWDKWNPSDPLQRSLKLAIDQTFVCED